MTTIEHVKGHIDILKYVKEQQAMTCCTYGHRRDCEPKPTGGPVLAMVSVSVRPSALNFATSSGCLASKTSSCVMPRLSSWRLARSYLLQSEPENTVTFNRPSP